MKKIGIRFWQLARRMDAIYRYKMEGNFIARGMQTYIIKIVENPGMIQDEISKVVKVDKGTCARAIQRLLDKQYIIREKDVEDKRKYRIFPSEKALEEYPIILKTYEEITDKSISGLSEEEEKKLEELLDKIFVNLDEEYERVKK